MSKWTKHKDKWSDCKECELCDIRNKVVLLRGKIPCDILFIGEAPGYSEDVLGKPFIGPAGKYLDKIIDKAIGDNYRLAFTNLIACIPLDIDGTKVMEPDEEHIKACSGRLKEIYRITRPKAIVMVGKLSSKWVPNLLGDKIISIGIIHPAAILRMDISQKGLAEQRTKDSIKNFAAELVPF